MAHQKTRLSGDAASEAETLVGPPVMTTGDRIGPYLLRELVGEGGFGLVYLAEQVEPVRRRVALKIVKLGMDTKQFVARFEAERQALAMMDHPNVAHIFDAGTTEGGRPYFVMEFVAGVPITDHCDRHRLGINDRLALFSKVCEAVQHAHQKGIIHRDIKPSNILVAYADDAAVPKVIDFGVAKALGQPLTEKTVYTEQGQVIGTLAYMSPEQAERSAQDIDTRSDIYSLGALLYELLTGRPPLDAWGREQVGFAETLHRICAVEPPRPSTTIGTRRSSASEDVASAASNRGSDHRALTRRLRGDLDWITMRCLEKDRTRRYASAAELAADVDRHLRHEIVLAGPPGAIYRVRKFARRNRGLIAVAATVLVLVVVAALWSARNESRTRDERAAQEFVLEISSVNERDLVRDLMERRRVARLAEALQDQPETLLAFSERIAEHCEHLNLYDQAATWRKRSLSVRRDDLGDRDREVMEAHYRLGLALQGMGDFESSEASLRAALARHPGASANGGTSDDDIRYVLAMVLWGEGDLDQSRATFEAALRGYRDARASPTELIPVITDFARLLEASGRCDEARRRLDEAFSLADLAREPDRSLLKAGVRHVLGSLVWNSFDFHRSELELRAALRAYQARLPDEDPRIAACFMDLALQLHTGSSYPQRSTMRSAGGDTPTGTMWRQGMETMVETFGGESMQAAYAHYVLALMLNYEEGREQCARALGLYENRLPDDHPLLADVLTHLGLCFSQDADHDLEAAESYLRRAQGILSATLPAGHWRIAFNEGLLATVSARRVARQDDLAAAERDRLIVEAERVARRSYDVVGAQLGPRHPWTRKTLVIIRNFLSSVDRHEPAEPYRQLVATGRWVWPFLDAMRDDDGTREAHVDIDFEDDHVEKVILIDRDPSEAVEARLWIFAQPYNYVWKGFRADLTVDDYCIRVNDDPLKEIRFNVAVAFAKLEGVYQWVPFQVPVHWLVEGRNRFMLFELHEENWRLDQPWDYHNLRVGIDRDNNEDRSWWIGGAASCCSEIGVATNVANKPLSRSSSLLTEHREVGFRECEGELMIFLELGGTRRQ